MDPCQFFLVCNTVAHAKIFFETLFRNTLKHLMVVSRLAFMFEEANTITEQLNKPSQK